MGRLINYIKNSGIRKKQKKEIVMRRLTVMLALFTLVFGLCAITVTVGDINGSTFDFPISTNHRYNYTQQIYYGHNIDFSGEITKIRFYVCGSGYIGNLPNAHTWTIYLGQTTRTKFQSASDWEPVDNLTQVFSGNVSNLFPADGGWMEITLNTPFDYSCFYNLLVAVHENTPGSFEPVSWGHFLNSYSGDTSLAFHSDSIIPNPNDPSDATLLSLHIATMQLVFTNTQAPMAPYLYRPLLDAHMLNGDYIEWRLRPASAEATGYDVYIDGTVVSSDQAETRYKLSGLEAGTHTCYVVARNQYGTSPPSNTRAFVIHAGVEIGDGDAEGGLPILPAAYNNYSQSIYLQSEIDSNPQADSLGFYAISKIAYYWSGTDSYRDSHEWTVYMGHTSKTCFESETDWIPIGQMEQVFDGTVFFQDQGWAEVNLDIPFLYNNADNLVIAVLENEPGCSQDDAFFYCTEVNHARSILYFDVDDININPNLPPAGLLQYAYPNILIQTDEWLTAPILSVTPASIHFGGMVNGVTSEPINVTVSNIGFGALNLDQSDISIIGPNAVEFSFDPANLPVSLVFGENVTIPVCVTGTTPGLITATLRIVYQGVNHDVDLCAMVAPSDVIFIGDGTETQMEPFGVQRGFERSAALYTADQITGAGTLEMLAWNCTVVIDSMAYIPYKIWMKNTSDSLLAASTWRDLTAGMTVVKQGFFRFNTVGWQMFQLDTPFVYTGAGLIVAVETNYGYYGAAETHLFTYTDVNAPRYQSWGRDLEPPIGYGYTNSHLPNIMMRFVSPLQDDICAVSVSGNLTPIAGEESLYTVRLHNNGRNVQNNYLVKLMGQDNTVLGSVNGPPVEAGAIVDVTIPWTPAVAGRYSIYGKVEMAGDESDTNNQTNPVSLMVQPGGTHLVNIGTGDIFSVSPAIFQANGSIYEVIYLEDELGFESGTITSLAYYNHFVDHLVGRPTQIFMGCTDRDNFNLGYINASQLTLVFDGRVDYPAGDNVIFIDLQSPFLYTGGNLVVMFYRPWEPNTYSAYNYFKAQLMGSNRACHSLISDVNTNPYDPPPGSLTDVLPQTTFFYNSELLQNDLGAMTISGNAAITVGETDNHTIRIRNNGLVDQDNYQVKLMRTGNIEVASVAGPLISSMQTLDIVIPFTPVETGYHLIYGKIEFDGDEYPANNRTGYLEVVVYPLGPSEVTAEVNDADDAVVISWMPAEPAAPARGARSEGKAAANKDSVVFSGYMVYRLQADQEPFEYLWIAVTREPTPNLSVVDTQWTALPVGDFLWAVKACYSDGSTSIPKFSNTLRRSIPSGTIGGWVFNTYGWPVPEATITNGVMYARPNEFGNFSFLVPVGTHTVTAYAPGYVTRRVENVIVNNGQVTELLFIMEPGVATDDPQNPVPATALKGNYPNPFNPVTTISYSVKEAGRVKLEIYNIKGQKVRSLVDENHAAGHYKQVFDARDNRGRSLSSGVYLIRMIAPGYQKVSKMMLMQ